jgi:putative glutamine amidotransferase
MCKPIIGIVGKTDFYEDEKNFWKTININDEFRYLVVKNGGIPISILPTDNTMKFNNEDCLDTKILNKFELEDLHEVIHKCDGIILQGGLAACRYEIEVAKEAIKLDIPMIGICAGFNNIIRALGSDVIEDVTNSHNHYDMNYSHKINIERSTIVYELVKKNFMEVNSIHKMVATRKIVEPIAKISSFSDDGYIESFELTSKKFIVGIKWHPELMLNEEFTNKLFNRFILECKK